MRKGEILGLRWKDVDLKEGKIRITQTLSSTSKGIIFQEPKTKGSKRSIDIDPDTIHQLKKHIAKQNEQKLILVSSYHDHDLVASIENGKLIEPRNLSRHFSRMIKYSRVAITLDTYGHIIPTMQKETASKFSQAMKMAKLK